MKSESLPAAAASPQPCEEPKPARWWIGMNPWVGPYTPDLKLAERTKQLMGWTK